MNEKLKAIKKKQFNWFRANKIQFLKHEKSRKHRKQVVLHSLEEKKKHFLPQMFIIFSQYS